MAKRGAEVKLLVPWIVGYRLSPVNYFDRIPRNPLREVGVLLHRGNSVDQVVVLPFLPRGGWEGWQGVE